MAKSTNFRHQYCLLLAVAVVLFAIGLIMLIVFAIPSLDIYGKTKHFKSSSCDVISANITGNRKCFHTDNADKDEIIHESSYPCLVVRVNYTDESSDKDINYVAQLFDKYSSLQADGTNDNITCSVHTCEKNFEENEDTVMEFMDRFGSSDSPFLCYIDPKSKKRVFTSIVNSDKVLHAFLWPSLALGFGFVIIVIIVFLACENLVCRDLLTGAKKARSDGKIYRLASFRTEEEAKSEMQKREMQAARAKSWRVNEPSVSTVGTKEKNSSSLLDKLKRFNIGGSLKDKQEKQRACELHPMKRRNSIA